MDENRDYLPEQIAKLEEAMKALPIELQNVLLWAMENFEALQEMGRTSSMTLEEIQKGMVKALVEENYATLVLLYITKTMKESKENEEI